MLLSSLGVRKALLARVIAYEELDEHLRPCDEKTAKAVRAHYKELHARTQREMEVPTNDIPLDQSVHQIMENFTQAVGVSVKSSNAHVQTALDRIRARGEAISCQSCSGGEAVCDGGYYDDELVAQSGHCISSFRDLFALTQDVAKDYHEAAGIDVSTWPACEFTLAYVNNKPHPFSAAIALSGETKPDIVQPKVTLVLQPETFDAPTYGAVAYVLLHEAFHVLGGTVGAVLRQGSSRSDPFAEGWLDWIAFQALERTAGGQGAAAKHAHRFRNPAEQIARGRQLHQTRTDETTSGEPDVSRELHAGQLAAERFFDLCQRFLSGEDDQDWRFFLAVSLRLNMEAMSLMEHRQLVWRVLEHVPFRRDLGTQEFVEIATNLRKYFLLSDIGGIIKWLRDQY